MYEYVYIRTGIPLVCVSRVFVVLNVTRDFVTEVNDGKQVLQHYRYTVLHHVLVYPFKHAECYSNSSVVLYAYNNPFLHAACFLF